MKERRRKGESAPEEEQRARESRSDTGKRMEIGKHRGSATTLIRLISTSSSAFSNGRAKYWTEGSKLDKHESAAGHA